MEQGEKVGNLRLGSEKSETFTSAVKRCIPAKFEFGERLK
jgi:hypothetical protein